MGTLFMNSMPSSDKIRLKKYRKKSIYTPS